MSTFTCSQYNGESLVYHNCTHRNSFHILLSIVYVFVVITHSYLIHSFDHLLSFISSEITGFGVRVRVIIMYSLYICKQLMFRLIAGRE